MEAQQTDETVTVESSQAKFLGIQQGSFPVGANGVHRENPHFHLQGKVRLARHELLKLRE